jgi:hypothetical protein
LNLHPAKSVSQDLHPVEPGITLRQFDILARQAADRMER